MTRLNFYMHDALTATARAPGPPTREMAGTLEIMRAVSGSGHADIALRDDEFQWVCCPDGQWDARTYYPGVVFEVARSKRFNSKQEIEKGRFSLLAHEYIVYSRGNINMVVVFDLEHRDGKGGTVSIFRPSWIEEDDGELSLGSECKTFREVSLSSYFNGVDAHSDLSGIHGCEWQYR